MPNPTPPRQFKVGDKIKVKVPGQPVDATIRAVVEHTDGLRLQIDIGHEQTALIEPWQVMTD